ncbi:MAG: hypothetical protein MUE85_03135 [Microscillaceae bacterium]|jgi:hypothetical protein|nr:hypothetical protein [Microscillaceae bacterium]
MKAFAHILTQANTYSDHLAIAWQNLQTVENEWKKVRNFRKKPNPKTK